jgi:predicted GTPase
MTRTERKKVLIMGAAGRDFHNFLVCFRDDPHVEVVAFTAAQIPGIANRRYPPELAGPLYPEGIPILPEDLLEEIVKEKGVDEVIFAYSDVSHEYVMHRASRALAAGADFSILGPKSTMLEAKVPVISICAVRTGCGKSGVTEKIWDILRQRGIHSVVLRHPMPYSDLARKKVERYATLEDLDQAQCTVEEREEYEHLVRLGIVVYAGVDYKEILQEAEKEAQIILWDGGNNDFPFIRPDLEITVADPHRVGHERTYHPGEVNLLRADVVVINKVNTAPPGSVEKLRSSVAEVNPKAKIVLTSSSIVVSDGHWIQGKRVLVVEDGPTITHGEMGYGAGVVAAKAHGAKELVDPRPFAQGTLKEVFATYGHLKNVLPAQGYFPQQLRDLEATIEATPCDLVIVATPIDLSRLITIRKPLVRVLYRIEEQGEPTLSQVLDDFLERLKGRGS